MKRHITTFEFTGRKINMKTLMIRGALIFGALTTFVTMSFADILAASGFEGTGFTVGQSLNGQGNFQVVQAPGAMLVWNQNAAHGQNCVKVFGSGLTHASGDQNLVRSVGGQTLLYDPVANLTPIVRLSANVRLDGANTGVGTDEVSAEIGTVVGGNFLQLSINANGNIYGGWPGNNFGVSTPYLMMGTYVSLEIRLDFNAQTMDFIVDGQSIGLVPMPPMANTQVFAFAIQMTAVQGFKDRNNYAAYFDDYRAWAGTL